MLNKNKLNKVAIIQARMGSTRLSGKVLLSLHGLTVLNHIVNRVKKSKDIDKIVVATTLNESDNVIAQHCKDIGVEVFRGSENNVLERYYQCAKKYKADVVIRVTADDPFKDADVIDKAINILLNGDYDYVSNTIKPTFPEGIDIEVFLFSALIKAFKEATLLSEKEHVTPYIWKNLNKFKTFNFENDKDLSHLRWTLDNPEDWIFTKAIYDILYPTNPLFSMADILALLELDGRLGKVNDKYNRNEGYIKSTTQDA